MMRLGTGRTADLAMAATLPGVRRGAAHKGNDECQHKKYDLRGEHGENCQRKSVKNE